MTDSAAEAPRSSGSFFTGRSSLLHILGSLAGLAIVIAFFTWREPDAFASTHNFQLILKQTVIVGICAVGMTFVITSAGIDLSVGSVVALASVVTAKTAQAGWPLWLCALAGIGTGTAVGAVNGSLVTVLKVVPFIVTLGTMGMARGVAKSLAAESTVNAEAGWIGELLRPSTAFLKIGDLQLPAGIWLFFLLAALMGFVLHGTVFGLRTLAIGSNESTARLCGVPVRTTKFWIYTVAGAYGGLAGVIMFGRLTVGDPTVAIGLELHVIAAVVIGGASLSGGEGTVFGSMLGALLMAVLANGCDHIGIPNYVQEILVGAIIVAAVAGASRGRE